MKLKYNSKKIENDILNILPTNYGLESTAQLISDNISNLNEIDTNNLASKETSLSILNAINKIDIINTKISYILEKLSTYKSTKLTGFQNVFFVTDNNFNKTTDILNIQNKNLNIYNGLVLNVNDDREKNLKNITNLKMTDIYTNIEYVTDINYDNKTHKLTYDISKLQTSSGIISSIQNIDNNLILEAREENVIRN